MTFFFLLFQSMSRIIKIEAVTSEEDIMTEKNLADEEFLDMDILNQIPTGIGIFDVTGTTIDLKYLNDGFYQMIDAKREDRTQFYRTGTIHSVHPDDVAGVVKEVTSCIKEKRDMNYRFRNIDGHGNYIWIGIRASHHSINPDTERFFVSYYNVDPYVSENDQLRLRGKTLTEILGNLPNGAAVFSLKDHKVQVEYANESYYTVHHGSEEYLHGQDDDPLKRLDETTRSLFWEELELVREKKKKLGSLTYQVTGEDGNHYLANICFRFGYVDLGTEYYYASFMDMDDLYAAEMEIRKSKQMYDDAVETAKLVIWTYDPLKHCVTMMPDGYTGRICRQYNIPFVLYDFPNVILPYVDEQDRDTFLQCYKIIDEGGSSASCEFRFKTPVHETMQYERISLKRLNAIAGMPEIIYGSGQNITLQKQNEEKFNLAYERLEDPNSYGSFHLNLTRNTCGDGKRGKSRLKNVLDLSKDGTVDSYFEAFCGLIASEETKAEFRQKFDRRLLLEEYEQGIDKVSIEYSIIYDNGIKHWREGILYMIKNPSTGDVEAVTYSYDIDDKKTNEFVMEHLIHEQFDYIGILHPSTKEFTFRSRKPFVEYVDLGDTIPYDEFLLHGCNMFEIEEEREAFQKALARDHVLTSLWKDGKYNVLFHRTIDGKMNYIQIQFSWLEEPGSDVLMVRTDITEAYIQNQKQISDLQQAKKEAEEANRAKTDFLSRMSHDMRTPLNGIIGMTYLNQQMNLPDKAKANLANIDKSSKFLLSLINDVLDMSKAENDSVQLNPEPYSYDQLSGYLDAVILPLIKEKNQKLVVHTDLVKEVPVVDELRINQILFNLISNAVKYTPENGTITAAFRNEIMDDHQLTMEFKISDTGIGMSEGFQKVLFDPFTQENRRDSEEMRGTGLGLAIVKKLVDLMHGTIRVESEIGKGSTFIVKMQAQYVSAEEASHVQKQNENSGEHSVSLAGMHILMCEDHPLNRDIAKAILQEKGAIVYTADDGYLGVQEFENSAVGYYDCILMDIRMPVMDGLTATRTIRKMSRPDAAVVPIIAMTANAFTEDIKQCMDAGMNAHIAKPIDPDLMFRTILNCFNEK
jgi:signal transduction histidine kinase/CheY-like chemotaxis protein/PAS domain-containing protein